MITERTFNVGFKKYRSPCEDPMWDETQFEIEDGSFVNMVTDLLSLWNVFRDECGFDHADIEYVEEVFGEDDD